MMQTRKLAAFILGCLLAVSCTQDEVIDLRTGDEITLSTFGYNNPLTRSLAPGDKIAVSAAKILKKEELVAFEHQAASNRGNNTWAFDQTQYWDNEALNYDFIAYAPAQANNLVELSPENKMLIWDQYDVSETLTEQTDLLVGRTYSTTSKDIQLKLQHLLAQINIKFQIDPQAPENYTAEVKSSNLTFDAPQYWDLTYSFDTKESTWIANAGPQTSYNFELESPFALNKEEQVAPGIHNLLLVPHQLEHAPAPYPQALNFTLEYSVSLPGNKIKSGALTFETEAWEAGHRYNYIIVVQDDGAPTPCDDSLGDPSDYIIFSPCYSSWESEESSYYYYV